MTVHSSPDIKPRLALLLATVLWASAFAGIRVGLTGFTPSALALLRFSIASLCMLMIYPALPLTRRRISLYDRGILLMVGALGLGCYNLALNYGEQFMASGITSFIVSLAPVFTVLFAKLFLGERFSLGMLMGMFVSILGVGLIGLSEARLIHFNYGIILIVAATVICGLYSVMQKPFLIRYHAIEVTAWIIWGCTLSLSFFFIDTLDQLKHASFSATCSVIYLGIFPAAIGYIAWSYGLKAIPASKAAGYMYYMPLFASLIGWAVLNEVPAALSLVGGLIVLIGVWIVSHQQKKIITQDVFLG